MLKSGVTSRLIWQKTENGTDYEFREITIAPGGSTGWHWHPGRLVAVVEDGTLTHNEAFLCLQDGLYQPGETISERSGADYVHIGRNLGGTPVVLLALYANPVGTSLAESAPNPPGCAFQ
jgi:quercetin dioxygenase-like cupin family protein